MDRITMPRSPARRRLLLATLCLAAREPQAAEPAYPEISWDDLMPKDWNPMESIKGAPNLAMLPDDDIRVRKLYQRLREALDNAPTVPEMAGRPVKLPGYVVPLDSNRNGIREFLLVPYFGACIHVPPPPANQIVHVRSNKPIKNLRTMDAVWASGTLALERSGSTLGASGYSMSASSVVPYEGKARR